jgi:hypothetical protein
MTSTVQLQRQMRRLIPVVVIVLGLVLISAVLIQQVAAQDTGSLKPPFKLNRTAAASSFEVRGPVALPLGAPIIMSQTFNSTYSPTPNLNQPGWHESYASGATSQYTWGYVGTAPLTDTVWCARNNPANSPQLNPATDTYTKGQQSLLIYGPLNLTDYTQLVMTGTYWLDTAPGDYFGMAYSTDGTTWTELYAHSASDPSLSQSHVFYASLNQLARQPVVWIALTFVSNEDNLVGRGAFVQEVVLRGNPAYKIFLPLIRLDPTPTPAATHTPTVAPYLYNYTFGAGAANDPDYLVWGGGRTTGCGSNCSYVQSIVTTGNPGGAMTLYMAGKNGVGGSSPAKSTSLNYELSADFYLYNGQTDARYSLIFNASASTFPDNHNPPIQADRNYYKLKMHVSETQRNQVVSYQLQKCPNGACGSLNTETNLPAAIPAGQWHNLKIRQQGTAITLYLNGSPLVTVPYDSSWGDDRRRFGVYIETRQYTDSAGQLEIFFDNVRVSQLP